MRIEKRMSHIIKQIKYNNILFILYDDGTFTIIKGNSENKHIWRCPKCNNIYTGAWAQYKIKCPHCDTESHCSHCNTDSYFAVDDIPVFCNFLKDILQEFVEYQKFSEIERIQNKLVDFIDDLSNITITEESKERIEFFKEEMKRFSKS